VGECEGGQTLPKTTFFIGKKMKTLWLYRKEKLPRMGKEIVQFFGTKKDIYGYLKKI